MASDQASLDLYDIPFYKSKDIYLDQIQIQDLRQLYEDRTLASYTSTDPIAIVNEKLNQINLKKKQILIELEQLKMDKIKNQLAGVAALLGVIAAIGGGFVKYGEIVTKLDALEGASGGKDWSADIAVLEEKVTALENADNSHSHDFEHTHEHSHSCKNS